MANGEYKLQPTTTHVVQIWYIPGGTDYNHASIAYRFYDDEAAAKDYADRYSNPPESAILMTRAEYEAIMERAKKSSGKIKQLKKY